MSERERDIEENHPEDKLTQSSGGMNLRAERDIEIEVGRDMIAGDVVHGTKITAETYIKQMFIQAAEGGTFYILASGVESTTGQYELSIEYTGRG